MCAKALNPLEVGGGNHVLELAVAALVVGLKCRGVLAVLACSLDLTSRTLQLRVHANRSVHCALYVRTFFLDFDKELAGVHALSIG